MTVSMEMIRMANPDRERTNQNAQIYLKTTLPFNNLAKFTRLRSVRSSSALYITIPSTEVETQ